MGSSWSYSIAHLLGPLQAMLGMSKLDIAALRGAADGVPAS
jgi:hypothetical protein